MSQRFQLPVIQSDDQRIMVEEASIVSNYLGMDIIVVKQKNREIKSVIAMGATKLKKNYQDDIEVPEGEQMYNYVIDAKEYSFTPNPYGPGKVIFLLDDKEEIPESWHSSAAIGRNREFLASHYDDFEVDADDEILQDIEQRYQEKLVYAAKTREEREAAEARIRQLSEEQVNRMKNINTIMVKQQLVNDGMQITGPNVVNPDQDKLAAENRQIKAELAEVKDMLKQLTGGNGKPKPEPKPETKKAGRPVKKEEKEVPTENEPVTSKEEAAAFAQ